MLLPSDVARLVLGYLQQEKLLATCREFILESSDLKEYAEHYTEEGFVPACLLSLFGKNLTTILNEYVAMKTKETTNEVPAIMSSLWKKLDYTLSQIRSMQNSAGFSANQRTRTRSGIAEMKRQRILQSAPSTSGLLSIAHQSGQLNSSCMTATQIVHRPMVNKNASQTRLNMLFAHPSQMQENNVSTGDAIHILVPGPQERKCNSSLLSPGRRKSESQKKKSIASPGPHSTSRSFQDSSVVVVEEESEPLQELIDGNFPQLVIENAREKILSNKSLQEKLAENINKILGSEGSVAPIPKQTDSGPAEQESSIDEIFGLQNEIHMSEEAIQDILEQTESDPAFQALFDLFEPGKNKTNKNAPHAISNQNGVEGTMLVDEDNLETTESSLETQEASDHSRETRSCTDYHSEEALCASKNSNDDDDITKESVTCEQSHVSGKQKKQTDNLKTVTDEQIGELEIAFESVPDLTDSNQRQNSGTEQNEHFVESFSNKESAEFVSESQTALEAEKDALNRNGQNTPGLDYDHSDIPQSSLALLDDHITIENRTYPGTSVCHLSPDTSLSEKTNISPSHRNPDHSVILKKSNRSKYNQSGDSGENEKYIRKETPILPVAFQQNSNHQPNCQNVDTMVLDCVERSVNISDLRTELQLEVVDTSNKPHSGDQFTLDKPSTKDLSLHSGSSDSERTQVEMQEPSSSTETDAETIFFSSGDDGCTEISVVSTEINPTVSEACHTPPLETACLTEESSTEFKSTGGVSSSSQPMDVDPSSIVSLKIIISDDPFISSDTELNNAVSSITGENLPTIILSSPAKTTGLSKCVTSEETDERAGDSASAEQNLLVLRPKDPVVSTANMQNEDCTVFSVTSATNLSKDAGFIQLMPAMSTAFGNSNNLYITTCVTDPTTMGTTVAPSNVVVLPGNSVPLTAQAPATQQLQTPPRSNMFTMNQTVSPNFSQGSAIIIASPVQPVLPGMVGMIPVSIVGQSGNTFSAPPRPVLHMPITNTMCNRSVPKIPIPPKFQKTAGARSKSNPGKLVTSTAKPVNNPSSRAQRTGNSDGNACADLGRKLEESSLTVPAESTSSNFKQNESHRRVLCFDSASSTPGGNIQVHNIKSSLQKERNENPLYAVNSPNAASASAKTQPNKREKDKTLPRILCKAEVGASRNAAMKDAQPERRAVAAGLTLDPFHKTTANKENELRRDVDAKQKDQDAAKLSNGQKNGGLWNEKTASVQEQNKKQGSLSNVNTKTSGSVSLSSKEPKRDQTKPSNHSLSLASPLTKQAVEMLHGIQWHSPGSKVVENGDLPVPRTPSGVGDTHTEDISDSVRTPTCRRYIEDSTTPRIMVPPATPDLPACSPVSETGSENSVSMAAHTLMILSRAAIARTNTMTPLKDNKQQFRSVRSTAKKRKLEDLNECERNSRSASKKELQSSTPPVKKKIKKKTLPHCFPAGMDVDKFLLSLHYDE